MLDKFRYNPARHKIGAVIRTTDSLNRYELIASAINNLLLIPEISLIHIAFYKPEENSELRKKLIEKFGSNKSRIIFMYAHSGNFHSDLLNTAFQEQTRHGVDYSLSISPEATAYITHENFEKILESIKNGSLVTGLKITEYAEIIEQGYFSNAFALYRNTAASFADIWGIHSFLQKAHIAETHFGMEELYTIKKLLDMYGKGSVTIVTPTDGKMTYANDTQSQQWKEKVLTTKMQRLHTMQDMLNIDPEEFKKMIIWQ